MPSHHDIKTAAYLDPMLQYAETRLGCRFRPTGEGKYSAHCPFHADTRDSFRVHVDGSGVVRFHCFGECKIEFSPVEAEAAAKFFGETVAKEYYYNVDEFLQLLSYDHGNKAMLDQTLGEITRRLEVRHTEPQSDRVFTIPVQFLQTEAYTDLGPALILWLRLAVEQQTRKRKVRETDSVLAEWLSTTRRTILSYKQALMKLGYLNIDSSTQPQQIAVRYFPRL
jgi:hypothetical protein